MPIFQPGGGGGIPLSTVTTKGDLIAATGNAAVSRLAAGTDGLFLKADSTQTEGLAWASPAGTLAYRSVTTTDSPTNADDVLVCSDASFTMTLFTAVGNTGKVLTIVHGGTNFSQVYTLATTGGQTIGGVASGSYALYTNGERLRIISDGSNWQILDHDTTTTPAAYTPTYTAFGTVSTSNMSWNREGSFLIINGSFECATSIASEGRVSFPAGAQNATVAGGGTIGVGTWFRNNALSAAADLFSIVTDGQAYVKFSRMSTTAEPLTATNGNAMAASGNIVFVYAKIQISGWRG